MKLIAAVACFYLSLAVLATPSSAANIRGLKRNGKGNGKGKGNDRYDVDESMDTATPPTQAEEHVAPSSDGDDDPDVDFQDTAELLGLSFNDAKELMKQQDEFSQLVADMEKDNNFLQAEMPPSPDGEYAILYKNGNVPPGRQKSIDRFKANNKANVKTVATKLSLKDAKGRGDRLMNKLEKKGYTNVSYSIDGDSLELLAKLSKTHDKKNKGKVPPGKAKEILDLSDTDPDADQMTLVLAAFEDEDPVEPLHTYGGRKVSGGGYQCTSAFSVVHSSRATGVATAAHCQGMRYYDALAGEPDYRIYWQKQHAGRYGDMEWHRTYHTDRPEYYAYPNTRWPVRSTAQSVSKGQVVCGYSRMQGKRSCDRVYKPYISVQYSGWPRMYNLVAMTRMMMVGGDSGGPWSYFDRAFGIVSGGMVMCDSGGCKWRDIWSRAYLLDEALSVTVMTQ